MKVLAIIVASLASLAGCSTALPLPVSSTVAEPLSWQTGRASYYEYGSITASGERFNPDGLTAAHPTLKFGTKLVVCRASTNRCIKVIINDRGPFVKGRVLDLSRGAMQSIGGISAGVVSVQWAIVR